MSKAGGSPPTRQHHLGVLGDVQKALFWWLGGQCPVCWLHFWGPARQERKRQGVGVGLWAVATDAWPGLFLYRNKHIWRKQPCLQMGYYEWKQGKRMQPSQSFCANVYFHTVLNFMPKGPGHTKFLCGLIFFSYRIQTFKMGHRSLTHA